MRSRWVLSLVALLLAAGGLWSARELEATAFSWGTVGEWIERCELGMRYARADALDEDPGMPASDAVEAGLCLGFLSGFEHGFIMAIAHPLVQRHGEDPPAELIASLDEKICVLEPYDEVVTRLVAHLRSEAVDPEADFGDVVLPFYLEHYPCAAEASE